MKWSAFLPRPRMTTRSNPHSMAVHVSWSPSSGCDVCDPSPHCVDLVSALQNPHEVPKVTVRTALALFGVLLAPAQCVRPTYVCWVFLGGWPTYVCWMFLGGYGWPGSSSQDQRLGAMGWQGLTSRAVKEKVAPPNINTAQQLNNWTINRFTVPVCIRVPIVCEVFACVCNHWAPGRVAFRLKATPVKIRIFTLYPLLPHGFYIKVCQYATIIRGGVRNVYARLWILSRNQFRFLARRWYNVASTL